MASISTLTGFSHDAGAAASARGGSIGQKIGQLLNHNPRRSLDVPDRLVVQLPRQPLNAAVAANSTSLGQGLLLEPDFGRNSRQGRVSSLQDVTAEFNSSHSHSQLPAAAYRLQDPSAPVDLPPRHKVDVRSLDNRELDKLVGVLGRNKATWQRALVLHEWLLELGHQPDDRLCTTLIRVCAQHGQALTALGLYDWMRAPRTQGGAGLIPTVFTYTAALRAALSGNLLDRAYKVWDDAMSDGCEPDCRMATTLIEVCARAGDTQRALATYDAMREAPRDSRRAPSVHAYTAAMRAAAEGSQWQRALDIWRDMVAGGCRPTGHAYAAVISACATGGDWQRAVQLFDEMLEWHIKPDVVSCTALITALGTHGQWQRAQQVVDWMVSAGIKPNVRTYTALMTAFGNAREWERALSLLRSMCAQQGPAGVEPNAYTYSALIKAMGEQGEWRLAEELFAELEGEAAGQPSVLDADPAGNCNPWGAQGSATDMLASYARAFRSDDSSSAQLDSLSEGTSLEESNLSVQLSQLGLGLSDRTATFNPLEPYGMLPSSLTEQVLLPSRFADSLPDDLPGQSNCGESAFSYFGAETPQAGAGSANSPASVAGTGFWTGGSAATSGLSLNQGPNRRNSSLTSAIAQQTLANGGSSMRRITEWNSSPMQQQMAGVLRAPPMSNKGVLNEVVCGTLMLAYERAGLWEEAVNVLDRARFLGIKPNTVMYNTALSALGKAGRVDAAVMLFRDIPQPDSISHETLVAAYGMAGCAAEAEVALAVMLNCGFVPRDFAYCALIQAYSMSGEWRFSLGVRQRILKAGAPMSVHVYNSLLAAAERAGKFDTALELQREMRRSGIIGNSLTGQLLQSVGRKGAAAVDGMQATTAALSAAVVAAGTLLMRSGIF